MTPAPIQCPHCGSYDVEWLDDEHIRCLDCGKITLNPPGLLKFIRREEDFDDDKPEDGENPTWDDVNGILD